MKLWQPEKNSHKGQNGKLMIIGGSRLFHGASLWALEVASYLCDMVFYSSVTENNEIVQKLKTKWRNGIVVPRSEIENYLNEADVILIGPGMERENSKSQILNPKTTSNLEFRILNLSEIEKIKNEGCQTQLLTHYLLKKYPQKRWVIDAGALQEMELEDIPVNAILTPHGGEWEILWEKFKARNPKTCSGAACCASSFGQSKLCHYIDNIAPRSLLRAPKLRNYTIKIFISKYPCTILLKGPEDIVCSRDQCVTVKGGNPGMTKGGTGDVLAGLVAGLYCKNNAFTAATAASRLNKKAGENLWKKYGYMYNASDLLEEVRRIYNKTAQISKRKYQK